MRNLNGFKWIFMLVLIGGSVNADIVIDNQLIPSADILSISILPSSGQINISTTGYTVTKDGGDPTDPNPVRINSFSASPSTITEGQSTTISWTTQDATSCAASGGTGGWSTQTIGLPSGSANITIASSGSYNFALTCEGSSGPVNRSLTVTVNKPSTTGSCDASPLSGTTKTWNSFWGVDFPQPGYDNVDTAVSRSGYLALEFETGNVVDNGLLVTVGNTITAGVRLGAISECPGDFDVAQECDHVWGIGGGINWATDGKSGSCDLQPNTTYYFNVTFTDGFDSTSSSCTSSQCIATVQHVNQ